tara:strand:+ start:3411 stop:5597 length:2187 start_codon:yes stop_codon:yes gene_type:complete
MAQNDIIDIDPLIDQQIDLSKPIPMRGEIAQPEPVIDKIYPPGAETPGQFLPNDFKNFLVDRIGIAPEVLNKVLGQPYSFRDRFINLNPIDALRDIARLATPGDQPLDRDTQQSFGLNLTELFDPTDPASKAAEEQGIKVNPKSDPAYKASKDASYLPPDQYDRGVKVLLKEAFPNTSYADLNIQRDPNTKRIVYTNPENGETEYLQPPGIDWEDINAVMSPVALEAGLGIAGFVYGNTVGRIQGGIAGGVAGLGTTAAITDSPFWQSTGAAVGAATGAFKPVRPIAFTVAGEAAGHFLWRYTNLKGMKERGVLDETYDQEKILKTAMNDSKLVAAFSLAGNSAFNLFAKYLSANPANTLGINRDDWVKAYEDIADIKVTGSEAEKMAVDDLSTVQILSRSESATPERLGSVQKEIDTALANDPEVELRFINQKEDFDIGYAKMFDEAGLDTDILLVPDASKIRQTFGRNIGAYFDPENISKLAGGKSFPKNREVLAKEISKKLEGADPESAFDIVWNTGKITKTETFMDMIPKAQQTEFKELIFRDFIDNTADFNPNAIQGYLNKHADQLKAVYGEEFVDGLRGYNKLIKDLSVKAAKDGVPENDFIRLGTGLARAYLGIFTRPGRVITAGTQITSKSRRKTFEKYLLDPDLLYRQIMREKLLDNEAFYSTARAIARTYEQASSGVDPETPVSGVPTRPRQIDMDLEGLEMNKGGSPLIELKYGMSD